ncbi:MAG: O-acetyl-ADP-ribose deacetylase [Bacteroidales bacterium]|nr:O-acetyl-ADP-ribose deacetylase [Bacteroidales bacterium]NCC74604.1 O-acetyl-ADP-ribose deacetylase [Sphingobacteriia bacterium]MDD2322134.1 O-acetyl-ADP-ribose deacetylase [Bacteroidales bacterium]MDD3011302.1 O-acetyl-ADP-ribose deacetylase [Bacteroidales bacterium]MDD3961404.1 O-acetyl-ADP-ribose deacetylase [Bacteroidales bacterium]
MKQIALIRGDITQLDVDAIVNAANKSLLGGGGVDGAIHRSAGRGLLEECRKLGGCDIGEAKITGGHNLKARYVIHTVGPVWYGGKHREKELLSNAYCNSLKLAGQHHFKTVAFPNISTGVYHYPLTHAAEIAINSTYSFLLEYHADMTVIFCCYNEENFSIYNHLLQKRPYSELFSSSGSW